MHESLQAHSHTVTGASTRCTLDSSTKTSRALWHSCLTSLSLRGSHFFSCSIHLCVRQEQLGLLVPLLRKPASPALIAPLRTYPAHSALPYRAPGSRGGCAGRLLCSRSLHRDVLAEGESLISCNAYRAEFTLLCVQINVAKERRQRWLTVERILILGFGSSRSVLSSFLGRVWSSTVD